MGGENTRDWSNSAHKSGRIEQRVKVGLSFLPLVFGNYFLFFCSYTDWPEQWCNKWTEVFNKNILCACSFYTNVYLLIHIIHLNNI